jgi:glycosyltransferase involved in cell wall biosynthesis
MSSPRFSVVVPTYNRAHLLTRIYESLLQQTFQSFEWIVADDGSSDGTDKLVEKWQREAPFHIFYFWQENSGRHVAINRAMTRVSGEFTILLDSDDWFAPNALERMLYHWESIPPEMRPHFAGVNGLCAYPSGEIIGTRFPMDILDTDSVRMRTHYRVHGDKGGMTRTQVLLEFPFPEDLGRYVKPSMVWNRIAQKYKRRFVNEVFIYKDYQPDGTSAHKRSIKRRVALSDPLRMAHKEYAELPSDMVPLLERLQSYANFARYSFHAGVGMSQQIKEVNRSFLYLSALPIGWLAYLWDRKQLDRENSEKS